MALGDRISRLVRANITDWQNKRKDHQQELEQTLREFKQSVNDAATSQQRLQRDYDAAQQQVTELLNQAKLALQQNDEERARELLTRKQTQSKIAADLRERLDESIPTVATLKHHLSALESQIDIFKASAASERIEQTLEEMPELDFAEIDAELELLRSRLDRL